jgi:ferrous iron transport protein B
MKKEKPQVLLLGNPNSGKTTLFNALSGLHQHVGNYPGVTVEKRQGSFKVDNKTFDLTDLPGTYSLSWYSPEERIAQEELMQGTRNTVVVVVVDSTTLKRSLVLLAQAMLLGVNPVLCLNMADEAKKSGQRLNLPLLSNLLGIPVVETVGHKSRGMTTLKQAIASAHKKPVTSHRLVLGERLDAALRAIASPLEKTTVKRQQRNWVATKLLLGEAENVKRIQNHGKPGTKALGLAESWRNKIQQSSGQDMATFMTERYYGFVDGLLRETLTRASRVNAREISDRIDAVVVHRLMGLPIFLLVMYGIFWLTFSVGEIPMNWIEAGFGSLGDGLSRLWPAESDSALRSLLIDGIISGVGGVLVFLPNIVLLFLGLAFLEDSGYMARAAFLMDKLMHAFGLHGKSFIPMMTGFGCSIPGIMSTRILENQRDRLTTMLVLPLMSCGARLPIWMLLIPAFYPPVYQAPMLWLIYMTGIALALGLAWVLRHSILKGDDAPFVMELPPYRLPTLRALGSKMGERSWLYLRKAGTVILSISIVMWFITSYPKPNEISEPHDSTTKQAEENQHQQQAQRLRYSIAGRLGQAIEPIISPLGFDWKIGTALIGAFAAKEVFVAQMGIVYSLGGEKSGLDSLRRVLRRDYSPVTGLSLMLFLLIATPCMATFVMIRRESGRLVWALAQFFGLTVIAYLVSLGVYQLGSLMG